MPAATANADRMIDTGLPTFRRMPLAANATPFTGSVMGDDGATGFGRTVSGPEFFRGFARDQVRTDDASPVAGGMVSEVDSGLGICRIGLAGIAQIDVAKRRQVYASDDNTFNTTGTGALIGEVIAIESPGVALVMYRTIEHRVAGLPVNGFATLPDVSGFFGYTQLNKLLTITPTANRTWAPPAAAECTGHSYTIKVLGTGGTFTFDPAGAELVDGAATYVLTAVNGRMATYTSTGSAWLVTALI